MIVIMMLLTLNAAWITVCCYAWKIGYNTGVKDMALKLMAEAEQPQPIISTPKQGTIEVKTSFSNAVLNSVPAEVVGNTAKRELTGKMIEQLEKYVHVKQDIHSTTFSLNLLVADKGDE